jgi:hypothetical protein
MPVVPFTIQCDVVFLLFGQRVENVIDVEVPGGIDAAVIADTANEVGAWVLSDYLPLLSASVVFLNVEAKNLNIPSGGVAVFNAPPGSVGGIVSPAEPGNVSFCVSLRTALSGRSFRGRKYVPGIPANKRTENTIDAAWAADIVAAFNNLISILNALDKFLVVVSRVADGLERTIGVATHVDNASIVDLFIDSQRRRLTGRGT